jgi:6-phosphogluconolactonase
MVPTIRVAASAGELALQAAEHFVKASQDAIIASGRFAVALSGGSTPKALYQVLATPAFAGRVEWEKVHILFSDERCVPADHPDSNFRMACECLLDHVQVPYENLHRMAGEGDPAAAADVYDQLFRRSFANGPDLVLLGLGEDGHTASLFPGSTALSVSDRLCVANLVPATGKWRITLTVPCINKAFEVLVLVSGNAKRPIVQRVLEDGDETLPISLIAPDSGRYLWLMDADAAGMSEPDDPDSSELA